MPKHDYIFVDESGDPGYALDPDSGRLLSSPSYVAAALHLCDDSFGDLNKHMAAFRFYSGLSRELKIPTERQEFAKLLDPIRALSEGGANIWASVDKLGTYIPVYSYSARSSLQYACVCLGPGLALWIDAATASVRPLGASESMYR